MRDDKGEDDATAPEQVRDRVFPISQSRLSIAHRSLRCTNDRRWRKAKEAKRKKGVMLMTGFGDISDSSCMRFGISCAMYFRC